MPQFRPSAVVRGVLVCSAIAGAIAVVEPLQAAPFATQDEQFLAGLRERRLYGLAEEYCRRQLNRQAIGERERVELTIEWLRTLTEHALHSAPTDRPPLWKGAEEIAAPYSGERSGEPRSILVRAQYALTVLARGELARLESEIAPDPAAALAEARETIRAATQRFEDLDRELTQAIPLSRLKPASAAEPLNPEELEALHGHVLFEWGRAFRNQALCYAPGSADRVAALTQSLALLERLRQHPAVDEQLGWQVRLARAQARRLLKDYSAAREELEPLGHTPAGGGNEPSSVPPVIRLLGRAELLRVLLDSGELEAALKLLALGRNERGQTSAELDFAIVEIYVAWWQAEASAKRAEEAAKWRDKAIEAVRFVEQTHGPYWGRRADILLVRAGGAKTDGSLEILRRAADDLYLKGQLDEAVAAYDKAAAAAREQDAGSAFQLAYKAALVQQQRGWHDEAARRFRSLALEQPNHAQAAAAHLLAIVNLAELCRTAPDRLTQYAELLDEHLAQWPYAASAGRVRYWQGGLHEAHRRWSQAVAAYQAVPPGDEFFGEALAGAERCWRAQLRDVAEQGGDVQPPLATAIRYFRDAARPTPAADSPSWTAAARQAALSAVRLQLTFAEDGRGECEQLLQDALAGSPPATADWTAAARLLLVLAVADQPGRMSEAQQILSDTPGVSTEQRLEFLRLLARLRAANQGSARREFAQLELQAGEPLWAARQTLPADSQLELARLRAEATAATGGYAAAAEMLAQYANQHRERTDLQAQLAEVLLASNDRGLWQKSLDTWRRLASQAPPRSPEWFQAKHGVARAQLRMGDRAGAAKLIRYMQATENLGRYGWDKAFESLLRECEKGS